MPFSPINFTSDGPPINGAYFLTIECNVTQGDAARKVQEWPAAQTGSPLTTLEIPSDCRRDDGDALRESGFDVRLQGTFTTTLSESPNKSHAVSTRIYRAECSACYT